MEPTRATLLMRLKADGPQREVAWEQFCRLYEPIVIGYARRMGARPDEARDAFQEVITGFFSVQPRFVYDPAKGRFRAYLKRCVANALRRSTRRATEAGPWLAEPAADAQDEWDRAWERQRLTLALDRVRAALGDSTSFRAFEAVVLRSQDPALVAESLGVSRDVVYQAKSRVLARLRLALAEVDPELDG